MGRNPDHIENPYRSPASNAVAGGSAKSLEKRLRFVLVVAMYLVSAVTNVTAVLRPEGLLVHLLFPLAVCSIMTYWCVIDARMLGSPIVRSLHWIIFFTWPVAVPIYLIWSRGLRGLGLALVHAVGLLAVSVAAYLATGYLRYGQEWFNVLAR